MEIKTTLLKALFLRMATYSAGSADQKRHWIAARKKLAAQLEPILKMEGVELRESGWSGMKGAAADREVTLDLSQDDIGYLGMAYDECRWPALGEMMEEALLALSDDLTEWSEQAKALEALKKLTPNQRKALAKEDARAARAKAGVSTSEVPDGG